MIRIDEIYNHCFWPFIKKHIPGTRLFFCDPFGHTNPENLFNYGHDVSESNFVYCHDQEPVYPDVHDKLFSEVRRRNSDLNRSFGPTCAALVVSERDSDHVQQVCSRYQWQPYYYFFHGWAALDWFRGYDRTFLSIPITKRRPSRIFFMPNRIIDGRRDHRVLLMYHLIKYNILDGWFSFPRVCPESNRDITTITERFRDRYADIDDAFQQISLPINFPHEQNHPMHSCWLSRFDLVADSEIYVVTETIAQGRRLHLTEKIFKPICQQIPFILVGTAGSLRYLREYGFQTFGNFWDESYDDETDDHVRIERVASLMRHIQDLPRRTRHNLINSTHDVVEHNYRHFYGGEFEKILWDEFRSMLTQLQADMR
jgi:hypothetical protein